MKPTKNNNSPYFFTLEELEFIIECLYYSRESYESKASKYRSRTSEDWVEDYYENVYKPTQAKFDNVRNKCIEFARSLRAKG